MYLHARAHTHFYFHLLSTYRSKASSSLRLAFNTQRYSIYYNSIVVPKHITYITFVDISDNGKILFSLCEARQTHTMKLILLNRINFKVNTLSKIQNHWSSDTEAQHQTKKGFVSKLRLLSLFCICRAVKHIMTSFPRNVRWGKEKRPLHLFAFMKFIMSPYMLLPQKLPVFPTVRINFVEFLGWTEIQLKQPEGVANYTHWVKQFK